MNRRQIYTVIVSFLVLFVLVDVVNAQSKDRANPTKLMSNEISGIVDSESRGNIYYYSFTVNPGEVTITLTVDPGRRATDNDYIAFTVVGFSVYDRNAEEVAGKGVTAANEQGSKQAVARIEVTRRQTFVLGISIPASPAYKSVGGKYRIRLEGSVDLNQSGSSSVSTDKTDSSSCLPKQGTLIIKMKDGSKKIIDLSEAETITVVP